LRRITRRSFILSLAAIPSYWYFELNSVAVKRYTVKIKDLPPQFDGFTILHLTDLHSKEYGTNQKGLLALINKQEYDLVAITGDLVDQNNSVVDPAIDLIKNLKKPIYFVPGNHDWWTNYTSREPLLSHGVHILENKSEKIVKGEKHIWLIGVDDPFTGRDDLDKAFQTVNDQMPRLLLAHAPKIYPAAIKKEIDLVLVGHTHGGQVRIPFVGAISVPGQGWFPEFDYGVFQSGTTTMIINGGLGESMLPLRIHNRPEIVLVTLSSEE
jgi:predicted MPP superfamily phosphohydrolase